MSFRFALPVGVALAACVAERGPLTNRMAQSSTSYLVRAARQPIGWQPWGREAFALAARLDRPILLYVGADECRPCAVMDRDAYGDPVLGALIDSLFVPVRVDRDERPDVARRYQAAVQVLAGLRGPPLTVFLTPDGGAFFGGTYFPADDPLTGRGLRQMLPQVARSYREQREFVERHAALVRRLAVPKSAATNGGSRGEALRAEIGAVRAALQVATRSPAARGSFPHALAVGLVLGEFGRTGDTTFLDVGTAVLDHLLDAVDAPPATPPTPGARDDPHDLVRAGLLRDAALAWALTADARYRGAARRLGRVLVQRVARPDEAAVFADRQGYVLASMLEGGAAAGDTATVRAAGSALDALLERVYASGRGVRHGVAVDVDGLLQDQVQVAAACIAAFEAFGEPRYLVAAQDLAAVIERDFADPLGGYFDTARSDPVAPALGDRTKEILDDLLPGANAWAARTLLRLAAATGETRYRRRAEAALEAFGAVVSGAGVRASSYLSVAREALERR